MFISGGFPLWGVLSKYSFHGRHTISRSIQTFSTNSKGDSMQRVIGGHRGLYNFEDNNDQYSKSIFLAETFEPSRFVFGRVSPAARSCHGHACTTTMSSQTFALAPGSSSEFVVVSSQRKRKNRPRRDKPTVSDLVERTQQDLQNDPWTAAAIQIVQESSSAVHNDKCLDVLCLGLGSPCSSPNSHIQFNIKFFLAGSLTSLLV
ncbi:hypothetical protein EV421DRAFT_1173613 [Armillaria borealis]|uniref:Uncharacterized protein n=1 Tax=Armillaria borealis TaxID=47425 RepID=A0AA39JZL6_9AGAR|nr:hypothetical protein EV421DRAFT_1173613 [Armillaria borealis]